MRFPFSPAVRMLRASIIWGFALLFIVSWNLWWHRDPFFFLGWLEVFDMHPERPGSWPVIPWFVPLLASLFVLAYVLDLWRLERRIKKTEASPHPMWTELPNRGTP